MHEGSHSGAQYGALSSECTMEGELLSAGLRLPPPQIGSVEFLCVVPPLLPGLDVSGDLACIAAAGNRGRSARSGGDASNDACVQRIITDTLNGDGGLSAPSSSSHWRLDVLLPPAAAAAVFSALTEAEGKARFGLARAWHWGRVPMPSVSVVSAACPTTLSTTVVCGAKKGAAAARTAFVLQRPQELHLRKQLREREEQQVCQKKEALGVFWGKCLRWASQVSIAAPRVGISTPKSSTASDVSSPPGVPKASGWLLSSPQLVAAGDMCASALVVAVACACS
jgi:hypothetical protein